MEEEWGEQPVTASFIDVEYGNPMLNTTVVGTLTVSNYRTLFMEKEESLTPDCKCEIPHFVVDSVTKKKKDERDKKKKKVEIDCKDVRVVYFTFKDGDEAKRYLQTLTIFTENTAKKKPFAWDNKETAKGERFFPLSLRDEYDRFASKNDGFTTYWKKSTVNLSFEVCKTYPKEFIVPSSLSDSQVKAAAEFRSRKRLPILSYYHKNGASILRCSQPKSGVMQSRSKADVEYALAVLKTSPSPSLIIADARPKINAAANRAAGAGYENVAHYLNTSLHFLNIENIHVMRESHKRLKDVCMELAGEVKGGWLTAVDTTQWLLHISRILVGTVIICEAVEKGTSVLIHCSDGWDRTAQLSALAMLLLDPYYRTWKGFLCLIEKEWVQAGHKFADRVGNATSAAVGERSPVFLQFLDCVWQLMQQHPTSFEFGEELLLDLAYALYSCRYGNFLFNCEKERDESGMRKGTACFWTHCARNYVKYLNPRFVPEPDTLYASCQMKHIQLWRMYYFQYMSLDRWLVNEKNEDSVVERAEAKSALSFCEDYMSLQHKHIEKLTEMLEKQGFHVPLPLLPDPPPLCSLSVSLPNSEASGKGKERAESDLKRRMLIQRSSTARIFSHLPRNLASSEVSDDLSASAAASPLQSLAVPHPPGLAQSQPLSWKGAQVSLSGSSRSASPRRTLSPLPPPLHPPSPSMFSSSLPLSSIPPLPDFPPPAPPTLSSVQLPPQATP